MNELAKELNDVLKGSVVDSLLSPMGKRMYFPKGIVAQAAEAGQKAKKYNATVGLSTKNGQPMHLSDIYSEFNPDHFKPAEIFSYAPGGGDKELRDLWKKDMIKKNPTLSGKLFSTPIVTAGLTHTISLVASMFVSPGDDFVCPDLFWDNYDLIVTDLVDANLLIFKFFTECGKFNTEAFKEALLKSKGDTVKVILNFPNNPTGYSPSVAEAKEIVDALVSVADTGKKILVLTDDSYFGLFFDEDCYKESLFSLLCDAHENILAIKGDAATKEELVWGFRIGFVTYGSKGLDEQGLDALTKKTLGAIRCTVSNCDRPGQSLLLKALRDGKNRDNDKNYVYDEMKKRYLCVKDALVGKENSTLLKPYPFNSGYFMAFDTLGHSAEELRVYLLDKYEAGTINIFNKTLRVAYCSVEADKIKDLIELIYKAAGELWS